MRNGNKKEKTMHKLISFLYLYQPIEETKISFLDTIEIFEYISEYATQFRAFFTPTTVHAQ